MRYEFVELEEGFLTTSQNRESTYLSLDFSMYIPIFIKLAQSPQKCGVFLTPSTHV